MAKSLISRVAEIFAIAMSLEFEAQAESLKIEGSGFFAPAIQQLGNSTNLTSSSNSRGLDSTVTPSSYSLNHEGFFLALFDQLGSGKGAGGKGAAAVGGAAAGGSSGGGTGSSISYSSGTSGGTGSSVSSTGYLGDTASSTGLSGNSDWSGGNGLPNPYRAINDNHVNLPPTVVNPEPASLVLLGSGLVGIAVLRRRNKRRK